MQTLGTAYTIHGGEPAATTTLLMAWASLTSCGNAVVPEAILVVVTEPVTPFRTSSQSASPRSPTFVPCWRLLALVLSLIVRVDS